jgi:hypothetical protein
LRQIAHKRSRDYLVRNFAASFFPQGKESKAFKNLCGFR